MDTEKKSKKFFEGFGAVTLNPRIVTTRRNMIKDEDDVDLTPKRVRSMTPMRRVDTNPIVLTRPTPLHNAPPAPPPAPDPSPTSSPILDDSKDPRKLWCMRGLIIVFLVVIFLVVMYPIWFHLTFDPVKAALACKKSEREELDEFHKQKYENEIYLGCFDKSLHMENEKLKTLMLPFFEKPPKEAMKVWIASHSIVDPGMGLEHMNSFGDSMLTKAKELYERRQSKFDAQLAIANEAGGVVKIKTHDITDEGLEFGSYVDGYTKYIEEQKMRRVLQRSRWNVINAANECYSPHELSTIKRIQGEWEDVRKTANVTWLSQLYQNHIHRIFHPIAKIDWMLILFGVLFVFCVTMFVKTWKLRK